jgi:hypothetical protein
MWGLWADLPHPTLFVPFGDARLATVDHALAAHAGELARNDYPALVRGRALANRVLGAERVFGFGQDAVQAAPYAELLTELVRADGRWRAAAPRLLDEPEPLPATVGLGPDLGWWLHAPSFGDRLRG